MISKRYNMSFTTGGLFYQESLRILDVFQRELDWDKTREEVLVNNLIQARTESSAVRRVQEVIIRLKGLTEKQLNLLFSGTSHEQLYLLWIAVCKRHSFITDFAIKVVREKFLRMDLLLETSDYEVFFQESAEWHEELDQLADSTKIKLRQVLFKIMREAEILSKDNMIIPGLVTPELVSVLAKDNPVWLTTLPVPDADIQGSL